MPGENEEEDDPKEWINNPLSLGIWIDTWQHVHPLKTQAPPTTLPYPLTSTNFPPIPASTTTSNKPVPNLPITNYSTAHAFKFSPSSLLKTQPTAANTNTTMQPLATVTASTNSQVPQVPQNTPSTILPCPHVSKCYDELERICSFLGDPARLHDLQLSERDTFVKRAGRCLLRDHRL